MRPPRNMLRGLPTIADVAETAGVSTATVSRTLSNPGLVGEATRAKVLEAVSATGYRINSAARDLRQRRARSLLILAPNLANTFFSRIFAAVQEVAGNAGLSVQISDSRMEAERLATLGHDGRADAIVLLDGSLDPEIVNGWRLPVIQLCEWNEAYAAPSLAIDNVAAAGMAVEHLAGLGHRSIAHVEGPQDNVLGLTRREGFLAAAERTRVQPLLIEGDFTMESGERAARRWVGLGDRPTAVFCASDECAFGFISQCVAMGLEVPRDVSVVGFDDVDFAERFIPALTTIHQPRGEIGRIGAERLVAALTEDRPLVPGAEAIPTRFVRRASTMQV